MTKRKKYKVGDRIFFKYYDGTIGTATVVEIIPETYINDYGKEVGYDWLETSDNFGIEDYNTLPYNDPCVKALMKELKKQDECADIIREFVNANTDIYNNETIAAALGQVAKEYGYEEE